MTLRTRNKKKKDRKELTSGGTILSCVSMIGLKSFQTQLTCLLCFDGKAFIAFSLVSMSLVSKGPKKLFRKAMAKCLFFANEFYFGS